MKILMNLLLQLDFGTFSKFLSLLEPTTLFRNDFKLGILSNFSFYHLDIMWDRICDCQPNKKNHVYL